MQLTSKYPGLRCTLEGIISERDEKGIITDKVLAHYMVFYQQTDFMGTAIYDLLIAELTKSRDELLAYYNRPTKEPL